VPAKVCLACGSKSPQNAGACAECGKRGFAPLFVREHRSINRATSVDVTTTHPDFGPPVPQIVLKRWWNGKGSQFCVRSDKQWALIVAAVAELGPSIGWTVPALAGAAKGAPAGRLRSGGRSEPLAERLEREVDLEGIPSDDYQRFLEAVRGISEVFKTADAGFAAAYTKVIERLPSQRHEAVKELGQLLESWSLLQVTGVTRKVRRACLAAGVAPSRTRFGWGTHFLVGRWSTAGMTHSMIRDLLRTDYGLSVSSGAIDGMLRRSAELFAAAYAEIAKAVRQGKSVHVDWTGWRVDGVNHHLWDFLAPNERAALFTVARSAGHTIPEKVLGKRRKDRVLVCDRGTAFNTLGGRKQRCWVHLLRHAKEGLARWETVSDAPDWRRLRVMVKTTRGVLAASRLSDGAEKAAEARRLKAHLARWPKVDREGDAAQTLQKFLTKHGDELWWWAEGGAAAHNNLAEQRLRPHIAMKRKRSWGSRTLGGAERFARLASVTQTGKMQGLELKQIGARVLQGQRTPFGFGSGPPSAVPH
jgi:hypothetical protein